MKWESNKKTGGADKVMTNCHGLINVGKENCFMELFGVF